MFKKPISSKAAQFTESVIREMTRLAMEHDAINLSQGYPDFSAPEVLKKAASDAIFADVNQYAITWGAKNFRDALVYKTKKFLGIDIDPEREITVSCGSTEAMIDVLLAVINPREELQFIAALCQKWDVLAITDEIYEHIIYDGAEHVSPITLPGMRDRTIVVNGMSKTFSVTGWRVGYIIAPPGITGAIRKMHDFITVGAPAPLQDAGAVALRLPDSYYADLATHYQQRRDRLMKMLEDAGL